MKRFLLGFIGSFLILSGAVGAQPRVDLMEGTLFFEGNLTFKYNLDDFSSPTHKFGLGSTIGAGYFVVDNLAVGASVPAVWDFSKEGKGNLGLKLFLTYFFDMGGVVFPYFGVNVVPKLLWPKTSFGLSAGVDTGFLISMSESVALDLGIAPTINFAVSKDQKWSLEVPAGFVGVRAFF